MEDKHFYWLKKSLCKIYDKKFLKKVIQKIYDYPDKTREEIIKEVEQELKEKNYGKKIKK